MVQSLIDESPYITQFATIVDAYFMTQTEKYFKLAFSNQEDMRFVPGQFVMLMIPGVGEAPISISSSPELKGCFELVVRNAGSVTGVLHRLEAGDAVAIRGPYGRGFPVDQLKGKDLFFIGGGCGHIPLHSLIMYVLDHRNEFGKVDILLGCKNPGSMLFENELKDWKNRKDIQLNFTVDQAGSEWKGNVGLITTLIPDVKTDPKRTYAVIVGPPVMYKFVLIELMKKNIPYEQIILSLERHMKCAVGKCGHCQIYDKYCCQDGPVFTYAEIQDNLEAI